LLPIFGVCLAGSWPNAKAGTIIAATKHSTRIALTVTLLGSF
jgi:hypothetical protein